MKNEIVCRSESEATTALLGRLIGRNLPRGSLVALIGPMASGKTALCRFIFMERGFVKGFCSPTYTIINKYTNGESIGYHIDASRLDSEYELYVQGFSDFAEDADIVAIEWADMAEGILSSADITIRIEPLGENSRLIRIGTKSKDLYRALQEGIHESTGF